MKQFSNNLKRIRKINGYTAKQLAKKLGMPYTTYVNYENQDCEPNFSNLIRIANMLHTTTDTLLGHGMAMRDEEFHPIRDERYYYIDPTGAGIDSRWSDDNMLDEINDKMGNCFRTMSQARKAIPKITARYKSMIDFLEKNKE